MSIDVTEQPSAVSDGIATNAADEATIRALLQELFDSWGRGDGTAYGALFTEDADYIAFDGSRTKGRQEIAASHQRLFDTWLKGTRLIGQIVDLRFLSPNVALLHASGGMVMPNGSAPSSRRSIQSLVATKYSDGWRFTAFHNNRIQQRSLLQNILFGIATRVFRR